MAGKEQTASSNQPSSFENPISHQLMYPEKFSECYKEGNFKITGREKCPSSQTFHVPQNPVLSRIKDFLPHLSQANKSTALELASNPDQKETLTIEPFSAETDESDDSDDSFEEEIEKKHKKAEDCTNSDQNIVEMNVALVPPEVLANFDDDDDENDASSSDEDLDGAVSMLSNKQHQSKTLSDPFHTQNKHSPLISSIDNLSPSDVPVKDSAPNG